jgi:hypothetical protein
MKALFKFLALLMLLAGTYAGGYISREFGPPVDQVLAEAGIHVRMHSPSEWTVTTGGVAPAASRQSGVSITRWDQVAESPSRGHRPLTPANPRLQDPRMGTAETLVSEGNAPATIDGEAYEARAGVRQVIGELVERIDILQAKHKEKDTACALYLGRGESEGSTRIQSLRDEQKRIERAITNLGDQLSEARDLELGLQRVINAAVEIDSGYVDEGDRLRGARRFLSR